MSRIIASSKLYTLIWFQKLYVSIYVSLKVIWNVAIEIFVIASVENVLVKLHNLLCLKLYNKIVIMIIITRLIVISIASLTELFCKCSLFCNCPLLKDISFNTKCLLVGKINHMIRTNNPIFGSVDLGDKWSLWSLKILKLPWLIAVNYNHKKTLSKMFDSILNLALRR